LPGDLLRRGIEEQAGMKISWKYLLRAAIAGAMLLGWAGSVVAVANPVVLVTEEEGAVANAPSGPIDAGNSLNTGPSIEVIKPEQNAVLRSPIPIVVRFVPNGRDVNLSSLKVEVLKLLTIDITKRVLPYASREGIQVKEATLPSGEHKLRVTIGDVGGGVSRKVFHVKIF
jgi:hypothetical protein